MTNIPFLFQVGSTLTGIGELVLDTDGSLNLQPPSNGSQYFLSIYDFDTLQGEQENMAAWWKTLAAAFALVGAAVVLWVGRRYYLQLKLHWERQQARREFDRRLAEATRDCGAPQDEDVENACLICLSQPRNCILLNCGHVCFCHDCYQALPNQKCPICRQDISRVLPLYYA